MKQLWERCRLAITLLAMLAGLAFLATWDALLAYTLERFPLPPSAQWAGLALFVCAPLLIGLVGMAYELWRTRD